MPPSRGGHRIHFVDFVLIGIERVLRLVCFCSAAQVASENTRPRSITKAQNRIPMSDFSVRKFHARSMDALRAQLAA